MIRKILQDLYQEEILRRSNYKTVKELFQGKVDDEHFSNLFLYL